MRKLLLRNRDYGGAVLIDPRFSDAATPFDDLATISGFPRHLAPQEIIELSLPDVPELLYRRSIPGMLHTTGAVFRIALPVDVDIIKGDLWPEAQ